MNAARGAKVPPIGRPRKHWRTRGARDLPSGGLTTSTPAMPIQFKTSGCITSIVLSIGLTVLLNLLIRSC
jgi:hypothetical protein